MFTKRIAIILSLVLLACAVFPVHAEDQQSLTNTDGIVYRIKEDGTGMIAGYTGDHAKLTIPETIDSILITEIGEYAFSQNKTIKSVVIPGTVKTIGTNAFAICENLKTVEVQEGVETIEGGVFFESKNLSSLTLPKSIIYCGNGAFQATQLKTVKIAKDHPYFEFRDGVLFTRPDHRLLWYPTSKNNKEYTVPDDTEIIESEAFYRAKVSRIILPDNNISIHTAAFHTCGNLKRISIPKSFTDLTTIAFQCYNIEAFDIPEDHPTLQNIDNVVFSKDAKELIFYPPGKAGNSYTVPDGTKIIHDAAFNLCKLTSIEIPGSVETIESNAFLSTGLTTVILHEGIKKFDAFPFQHCHALVEIELPASLTDVEINPFAYCSSLKNITVHENNPALAVTDGKLINRETKTFLCYPLASDEESYTVPDGIETIAQSAFDTAGLHELILPEGVKTLPPLYGCRNLERIVLPSSLESTSLHLSNGVDLTQLTCVVKSGSFAEEYCKAYDLKYEYAE